MGVSIEWVADNSRPIAKPSPSKSSKVKEPSAFEANGSLREIQ
jgi:hypothetical protein